MGEEIPEEIGEMNDSDNEERETNILMRDDARRATETAVNRMVSRSTWRNDYLEFKIGTRVQIRPDTDANEAFI